MNQDSARTEPIVTPVCAPANVEPVPERRGEDRRAASDRRSNLDRRRGPGRRRTDFRRAAEEGHMNEEQVDFLKAIDEYKRVNHRPFPTWTEVLDVVLFLGYRRVAPIGEFTMTKARQTPLEDDNPVGEV
jgi:hypothetical protein